MEVLQIPSTTISGVTYKLTIEPENNRVTCTCQGFISHGYCKHIRAYKNLIRKKLYGEDFVIKVIKSFNNCYDFIKAVCKHYPECIGDYDTLDYVTSNILSAVGKHYTTETIHRNYRLLVNNPKVENDRIVEPDNVSLRKEKTEVVMHNINQWYPKDYADFKNGQTKIDGSEVF